MNSIRRRKISAAPVIGPWPQGFLGPLTITNGQTVTYTATSSNQYYNLGPTDIQTGGILRLRGKFVHIFGIRGNLNVDGQIICEQNPVNSETVSAITPLGFDCSYTNVVQNGTTGKNNGAKTGGQPVVGTGGGGASIQQNGGNAFSLGSQGGQGGLVNVIVLPPDEGVGSSTFGGDAPNATINDPITGDGGAAGGGRRGQAAAHLYMLVTGNLTGAGQIIFDGQIGGNGGVGKTRNAGIIGSVRGGGGGGACGGNAGNPIIHYRGSNLWTVTFSGLGGSPGTQGTGPSAFNLTADFGLNGVETVSQV